MISGEIEYRNLANGLFVIKLTHGKYTVFESFDINDFNIGDKAAGNFDCLGPMMVLNASSQKQITIIVKEIKTSLENATNIANGL